MIRTVFCSGPMAMYADTDYGFAAFDAMKAKLTALGYNAVTPADIDRHFGFDGTQKATPEFVRDIIMHDLKALEVCDAVLFLPHWEMSKGCAVERAAADYWGIPMFESVEALLTATAVAS